MSLQTQMIGGWNVPRFLYGTAWKEEQTERLTRQALDAGFRGIDTANQRRHYYEEGVGRAVQAAIAARLVRREELFLQTKFTFQGGQDHRLPYDPAAPIGTQVAQSLASSLDHFGTQWVDSLVLHGPSRRAGLGPEDWQAWQAMEEAVDRHQARLLGVSNVSRDQLALLCERARVRPAMVQNRCFAVLGWDREVRELCHAEGIVYQGFSLLTANREMLIHPEVVRIARRHELTTPQVIFRFALDVGMIPLTGSSDAAHLREDLAVFDIQLAPADVSLVEQVAG